MFDCGIMDLFSKLQELLNKIYIRHRDHDDMLNPGKAKIVADEISSVAEELPQFRLIFLTPTGKDALLKFSTWIISLLNFFDKDEGSLVYAMPTLLIDIPFDIFRALKRTN